MAQQVVSGAELAKEPEPATETNNNNLAPGERAPSERLGKQPAASKADSKVQEQTQTQTKTADDDDESKQLGDNLSQSAPSSRVEAQQSSADASDKADARRPAPTLDSGQRPARLADADAHNQQDNKPEDLTAKQRDEDAAELAKAIELHQHEQQQHHHHHHQQAERKCPQKDAQGDLDARKNENFRAASREELEKLTCATESNQSKEGNQNQNKQLKATSHLLAERQQNHFAPRSEKKREHEEEANHRSQTSFKKTNCRRLSYLQSLLLRRWPCLALTICIMSSLIFGMLLSALTVYLMHGVTDCSNLALAVARESSAHHASLAASSVFIPPHELLRAQRPDFDTPLELHGGGTQSVSGANQLEGRLAGAATATAAATAGAGNETAPVSGGPRFQRLPSTLWPVHYDLFVQPHIAEPFNFNGKVSIRIRCAEPTDRITLHTLDLNVNEKSLSLTLAPPEANERPTNASGSNGSAQVAAGAASSVPKVSALSEDKQLQYSIIKLDANLEAGREYLLALEFTGLLNDDLAGFYKIKFERQNATRGEATWIAATQFQATDARRAFPCFDEPLYKATFSIQIKHWKNMTALSNMPIVASQDSPDGLWVTDTFAKSHRMSTYLVAYAVTDFESRSEGNISVWTRPGLAHSAEYALRIAGRILRHYESFFGIEYPLPKMDMIALPDFNAGAMENWGLITYRETAMLYDPASSSIANKQRVAVVVAHELAHQWFGNLVTPKWWDDLWLNEGFASYVEYIGVDHVEPTWRMLDQFVIEEVQNVFKMDGLSSSHQISIPVNNPDEISEIFDHISYAKGASIIRMMSHFLTEDVFKAGLRRYLRALRYSNAEQSDLWAHLTDAQKFARPENDTSPLVNVERVMNSWTLQTGYPLVSVTRDYERSSALLEQARYQPYKLQEQRNKSDPAGTALVQQSKPINEQRWEIPITLTWKSEQNWQPRTRLWLHQNESQPRELRGAELVPSNPNDWMLLNVNQVGYYRVNYDARNWRLLIDQLNADHTRIGATNRAQILDDIFELARSGLIDYRFALESTRYLKAERDYLPWDTVLMSFSYIDDMLQRTPLYGDWRDYVAELVAPYYARYKDIDWLIARPQKPLAGLIAGQATQGNSSSLEPNDVLDQYNQVNAASWACQVNEHCISKARATFEQWRRTGKNEINPALRFTVYCTAIENGHKDDWDFLWRAYELEQNASERDRILRALGCTREIWLLSRYLEWTFNKAKPIRRQDGAFVFRMIAKNNYGRDVAFNFMRERWATIKEYYGKTSFSLGNLIRSVATSMNTQVELNQLVSFYESIKGDVGTGKRSFQIAIEEVESNVSWRNRNYKIIDDWIREQRTQKAPNSSRLAPAAA